MTARTFIFAGGGTGGHIYPALAIAEALRQREAVRTIVICSDRPLDAELLTRSVDGGEADGFVPIPARPFGPKPRALARLLGSWGVCVRAARTLIRGERDSGRSVQLVAMGGFVAPPAVQGARAEKCPVCLVNLDAAPGLANRWIARRVPTRFAVGRDPGRPAGVEWEVVPPIVRRQILESVDPREARRRLDLDPDAPTLLVTGGSQGARSINAFLMAFSEEHAEALRAGGWQILHQSGLEERELIEEHYHRLNLPAAVSPTIASMGDAWAAADCAVGRAGAGTVAEVWATRTPALLLPYPYHADEHQRLNAEPLAGVGGIVLAKDRIDAGENLRAHGGGLLAMLTDPGTREAMRAGLGRLGAADGADRIAARLLGSAAG